jgi:hypothetical protein
VEVRFLDFISALILNGVLCIADVVLIVRLYSAWMHRIRSAAIVDEIFLLLLQWQTRRAKNPYRQRPLIALDILLDYIQRISHINQA